MRTFYPAMMLIFGSIIALSSCSKSSNNSPTSTGPGGDSHFAGEFGFSIGSSSAIDRKDSRFTCTSSAQLLPNGGFGAPYGGQMLSLFMEASVDTNFHSHQWVFRLNIPFMTASAAGSYQIGSPNSVTTATATYSNDTANYDAKVGGTIVITEFDTVKNGISGTFSITFVNKTNSADTVVLHSAYFYQVPLYLGSFGQGVISADIEGRAFTSAGGGMNFCYGLTNLGGEALNIQANNNTASNVYDNITLVIPKLAVGDYYSSGDSITHNVQYLHGDGALLTMVSGQYDATGRITITSLDTVNHRFSGTFSFSGTDHGAGNTIHIRNGVMTNVLYFHL
jgi:hypothetical protein